MKNNVATSLPVQLTHAVIVTDALGIKAASVAARDQAMTGLFMGLTRAVQKGAHVDLSDPLRIVVTKPVMANCNCLSACRPGGFWTTVGDRTYPAATHLASCLNYKLETFVRVEHDGSSMLMEPAEAEAMHREDGDTYKLTEVILTRDQFNAVPESAGF